MLKLSLRQALLCSALASPCALAADISFNGFATLAGGVTTDSDKTLLGYDGDVTFDVDSLFGLQANADLGDGLSAVGQLVARGKDSWDLELEWGYVGYQVNDSLKLIAGKQRTPYYVFSDYLDVSYAYHWLTPPNVVYELPFQTIDGLSVLYSNQLGSWESQLQVAYGSHSGEWNVGGVSSDTKLRNYYSASWSGSYDWFSLRLGYATGDITFDVTSLNKLADAWDGTGIENIAENLRIVDDKATFLGLGVTIDYGNWLATAEITNVDAGKNIFSNDQRAHYVSVGYRLDSVLLHTTVGAKDARSDMRALAAIPRPNTPPKSEYDLLYHTTNDLLKRQASDNKYWQIGVRWDFHPSAAFKLEYMNQDDKLVDEDVDLVRFGVSSVF